MVFLVAVVASVTAVVLVALCAVLAVQNRRLKRQKKLLEHTSALIDSAPYYIAFDDAASADLYANRAAYRLTGHKPGAPLAKETTHDEKGMRLLREVAFPAMEKYGAWVGENQLRHSDGHMIDVQQFVFPVTDKDGRRLGQGTLMRDITEEKKMRQDMDIQQALLNSSSSFIVALDKDFRIIYANPGVYAMSGYNREEVGLNFTPELFHSAKTSQKVREDWRIALQEGAAELTSEFVRSDGECIDVTHKIFAIRDQKGEVLGVGSILNDVTELKKTQQELTEAKEAAEEASRAKSFFLSNMSHEIRTPMNAIIGMAQIAKNTSDPDKIKESLEKVEASSEHLLNIINDVLDLSKIESGKLELYNIRFDLEKNIQSVTGILRGKAEEKRQALAVEIAPDVPKVLYGDANRLSQVVMNLLSNAVKFTGDEGRITLAVRKLAEAGGCVTLEVSVTDTGIGLTPAQQQKLFQPFEQTGAGITSQYGGTGLGLAISQRLVRMMGGEFTVKSAEGAGSRFSFTVVFEAAQEDAGGAMAADSEDGLPDFSARRILVAEDIEINREVLAGLLAPTGVTIDEACNGAEAVEMYTKHPTRYDLIFMDLQMPQMDGFAATGAIRESGAPGAQDIPILAMTANAFDEDVQKSLAAGMNGHISKPIDAAEVVRQMQRIFARLPAQSG